MFVICLCNAKPTDIDFVTESSGIKLAETVAENINPKPKVSVFKTYGTAMIKYQNLDRICWGT